MRNLLIITQKVDENDQLLGFFVEWIREFERRVDRVTVVALNNPRKSWPKLILRIFWRIPQCDAVFVHMSPIFAVIAAPWARLWGKHIGLWYTHKAVTPRLRLAEKLVNVVFTASPESFRLPSNKVIITGHGIDTELFRPNHETRNMKHATLKILSVGRIAPIKNYEVLIGAAKILKDDGYNFSVTMVGEPALAGDRDYESRMKDTIKNAGLENEFNFVGKVINRELPRFYQSHDVFVHMSKTGSLDKTLLEAMACGIKVLSSNDAAKSFLPRAYVCSPNDPKELALKVEEPSVVDFDTRQYVIDHHDVRKLILRITSRL